MTAPPFPETLPVNDTSPPSTGLAPAAAPTWPRNVPPLPGWTAASPPPKSTLPAMTRFPICGSSVIPPPEPPIVPPRPPRAESGTDTFTSEGGVCSPTRIAPDTPAIPSLAAPPRASTRSSAWTAPAVSIVSRPPRPPAVVPAPPCKRTAPPRNIRSRAASVTAAPSPPTVPSAPLAETDPVITMRCAEIVIAPPAGPAAVPSASIVPAT